MSSLGHPISKQENKTMGSLFRTQIGGKCLEYMLIAAPYSCMSQLSLFIASGKGYRKGHLPLIKNGSWGVGKMFAFG